MPQRGRSAKSAFFGFCRHNAVTPDFFIKKSGADKFLFLGLILCTLYGCAPVLIGGAAAAGYIVVTQDYAATSVDTSYSRAWATALDEVRRLGTLEKSFQKLGEVHGVVQDSKIRIWIFKLTEKTVDIKVAARKNMLPNTELAQGILAAIVRKLD